MGYIPVDMIQDGDYTQIPPTRGFFPQYMDEIVRVINENMNTSIQVMIGISAAIDQYLTSCLCIDPSLTARLRMRRTRPASCSAW